MDAVINVKDLYKSFGSGNTRADVLRGVSLRVERGEFLSVMGPSGCGKSTLLYLIGGLDRPDRGSVELFGQDIISYTDAELSHLRRRKLGFVFQFYNLVQNLSVEENILLPIVMDGIEKKSTPCSWTSCSISSRSQTNER